MPIELKYYKYTDPETGKESKSVGLLHTRKLREYKAKLNPDNTHQVLKDNEFTKTTEHKPAIAGAIEITKAEYDALVVDENPAKKKKREKEEERLALFAERVQRRESTPQERRALREAEVASRLSKRIEKLERIEKK